MKTYDITLNEVGCIDKAPGTVYVAGVHVRTGCRPEGGNTDDIIKKAFFDAGGTNRYVTIDSGSPQFVRATIELPDGISDGWYNVGNNLTQINGLHSNIASENDGNGATVFVTCDPLIEECSKNIGDIYDRLKSAAQTIRLLVPTGHGRIEIPVKTIEVVEH